jgi:glycerol-3-phosphate cytidylyltransferase-like family protein
MDLMTRCQIVSCVRNVDYVIPFENEEDITIIEALRRIKPHVYTRGCDQTDLTKFPEWQVCQELGIELVSQVGRPKLWNSSDFLKEWGEFVAEQEDLSNWILDGTENEMPLRRSPCTPETFDELEM